MGLRTIAVLCAAVLVGCAATCTAAEADAPGSAWSESVRRWTQDAVFRPIAPFELVPEKNPDGWTFMVEPYFWTMSLNGDIGIKNLGPAGVRAPSRKLLENLNWGLMGRGEVRKGRWGILGDGFFASLEGGADLRDVLYQSGSLGIDQGLASVALAYRIIDDRRGFLDVYAGARYNYLGMDLNLDRSTVGANALGQRIAGGVASRIDNRVVTAVDAARTAITSAVSTAAEEASITRTVLRSLARELGVARPDFSGASLEKLAVLQTLAERRNPRSNARGPGVGSGPNLPGSNIPGGAGNRPGRPNLSGLPNLPGIPTVPDPRVLEAVRSGQLSGILSSARGAVREYVREVAAARVAQIRGTFGPAAQARLAAAQQRLASRISQAVYNAIPTGDSASRAWVDPIIGVRGQINLTRWLFLAAQGDTGGFGVGSDLTWVTQATAGINLSRHVFVEAGYRYMYVDYDRDNFLYKMNTSGWFGGLGFKF